MPEQNSRRAVKLPPDLAVDVPTDEPPSYLSSFLAGVDPRGTWTLDLGRRTPAKHYAPMQTLGTVGGFLGGAAVVPGIISGLAHAIPTLLGRGGLGAAAQAFGRGAIGPYKGLWNAVRARSALKSALKGKRALTQAERDLITKSIEQNVPIGAVTKHLRSQLSDPTSAAALKAMQQHANIAPKVAKPMLDALKQFANVPSVDILLGYLERGISPPAHIVNQVMSAAKQQATPQAVAALQQLIGMTPDVFKPVAAAVRAKIPSARKVLSQFQKLQAGAPISEDMANPLLKELGKGIAMGSMGLGFAGGITGYSAYKQYALGQQLRKEQQEAAQRVVEAYRRGRMGKYSSERLMLVKRALEKDKHEPFGKLAPDALTTYAPQPLTSLTARSDYAANEKYEPRSSNPLTAQEQAALDMLYGGMSKSRQRVVDAHKRGRTTLSA